MHSLHAYFLRRGDFNAPIVYEVDRSRDGASFTSRRVVAIQHGQPILVFLQIYDAQMDQASLLPAVDVVIISDYGSGLVTPAVWREAVAAALKKQVPAIMKQYNCKEVEFKVVIKDGKAKLTAVPKS